MLMLSHQLYLLYYNYLLANHARYEAYVQHYVR